LQGVVTRIDWVTPSAFFFLDVRDATGTVANWAVEIGNPIELERDGWKRSTLQIGDTVAVDGLPARSEARQASAKSVTRTGKRLFAPAPRRAAAPATPAPRWPDGKIRLGPPPGKNGILGITEHEGVGGVVCGENSMSEDGLLTNISDADKVAPFLPWSKAIYENRQRRFLRDDPYSRCIAPGGPRQFQMPNGFQFVEQKELGRILVLLGGGDRNWRVIYTDGRPLGAAAEAVPSYYGVSVGRWEKDTLVVNPWDTTKSFGSRPVACRIPKRYTSRSGSRAPI
jgi:hypothetical protein